VLPKAVRLLAASGGRPSNASSRVAAQQQQHFELVHGQGLVVEKVVRLQSKKPKILICNYGN